MTDIITRTNPFHGPRSFQIGDKLYGRDRETRDLLSMLIAERIVLLHSPSGAGKTSLIQAALIPLLEDREFWVLPVVRLNADPGDSRGNRYVRSAMLSLEESRLAEEQIPAAELENLDLGAYLDRIVPEDEDALLIIDQFEEVLTLDPTDIAAKHAFFNDLGHALRKRRIWALISMREDYVAAVDPYLRHLPNRLSMRFRLDLLSVDGARQALREPPHEQGVNFAEDAADRLIDDLRRVNVQRADGSFEEQLGPHVEPVQLQVLGLRLWNGLAADDTAITLDDVARVGNVNQALGDYYADCVRAAAVDGVTERAIRTWFDRELITPQGVRGQVLQGQGESAGLPNSTIRQLVNAYLVRADARRGLTWFELAHDRLIAPIRSGNTDWFETNLSTLQRQADLWDRQGRPNGLLLRGDTLNEAEAWANANQNILTSVEQDFLTLCRQAHAQAQRIRNLAIGASILATIATIAFFAALWFYNRAQEQRLLAEQNARSARSRELAAAAVNNLAIDPQRSLILALAAIETKQSFNEAIPPAAVQALQQAVQANRLEYELRGHSAGLRAIAYNPAGTILATTGVDGTVRLWNPADGSELAVLAGHADEVYAVAFSPDGALLASGGFEGEVILWDVNAQSEQQRIAVSEVVITDVAISPDGATLAVTDENGELSLWNVGDGSELLRFSPDPDYSLDAVAFNPDGSQIAVGGGDALVRVWDLAALQSESEPEPLLTLSGPINTINRISFSPDGAAIAAVALDLRIFIWDNSDGSVIATLQGHSSSVFDLAFNADGSLLASASSDGTAKVWRIDTGQPLLSFAGHTDFVYSVAFSPDGQQIATASLDGSARIWSMAFAPPDGTFTITARADGSLLATIGANGLRLWDTTSGALVTSIAGSESGFTSAVFDPSGNRLAIGDNDGMIYLYSVAALLDDPEAAPEVELVGHEGPIARLRFTPDGTRLFSASDDSTVRAWDVAAGSESIVLEGFGDYVYGLAISPDGSRIAAGDQSGTLILWDSAGNQIAQTDVGTAVNSLAFSPDGTTLAAGTDDGNIYRYDAGLTELETLSHGAAVSFVAYTPSGELLSAAADGRIRQWRDNAENASSIPAPASIYAFGILPDARIASVGVDGVIHVYTLNLADLQDIAQNALQREPSEEECATYQLSSGCE